MRGMIDQLMSGVLQAYDVLVSNKSQQSDMSLNQLRSLQLLFDLKFLTNILTSGRDDSEVQSSSYLPDHTAAQYDWLLAWYCLSVCPFICDTQGWIIALRNSSFLKKIKKTFKKSQQKSKY